MGTINYRASDIITLGYNTDDFIPEDEFEQEDFDIETEDSFDESKAIVDDFTFNWFTATLKSGYYDGYYLDLDKNYITGDLEIEEVQEIKNEIDILEKMLLKLIEESNMNVCYPWWCTKWENYDDSLTKVKTAMNELRKEIA